MFRVKTISDGQNNIVFKAISDGKIKQQTFYNSSDEKILNNRYFKTIADGRRIISMLTQLFLKLAKADRTGAIGLPCVFLVKVMA